MNTENQLPETSEICVSIIIPSYNSIKTLPMVIKYLDDNRTEEITEIIIVDSSDDTVTREWLDKLDPGIYRVIYPGTRIMPAVQRNIGAKRAKGNLFIFIDSDILITAGWLACILDAYKNISKIGSGGFSIPRFQKHNKIVIAQYYLLLTDYLAFGKPKFLKRLPSGSLYCDKELFFKTGGFPEIRASEDMLFSIRASRFEKLAFIPNANVHHIFREGEPELYYTQKLYGYFVFKYKKDHYNHFYYKGIIPFFLLPFILIFKYFKILYNTTFHVRSHSKNLIRCHIFLVKGLLYWGKGFIDAGIENMNRKKTTTCIS